MKTIPFWKMSGSGNDFVLVDNRRRVLRGRMPAWAKTLCHRQFGVGADGLLLLERLVPLMTDDSSRELSSVINGTRCAFRMVYYNADGSRAAMCGNGARCMAWFAKKRGVVGSRFRFQTDAYPVSAHVARRVVRVSLADARDYLPEVAAKVGGRTYHPAFINTGVPHAVLFVPDAGKAAVGGLGRALRFHQAFGRQGANVNFVQKTGPRTLRVRTYERGVEGETLACGTGVTAGAIAAALRGLVKTPVRCVVAGGDTLEVNFTMDRENRGRPATGITLTGPVRLTFKGEINV